MQSYLQGSGELAIFTIQKENRSNSSIVETKSSSTEFLCDSDLAVDEEDGNLAHKEATADSLECVLCNKVHGCLQAPLLTGLLRLEPLDSLNECSLLHGICEADLGVHLIVVERQSDTGSSRTVALRNGDVIDQTQNSVPHVVETGTGYTI